MIHRVPTCRERLVLKKTHKGGLFHTDHQRIEEGNDDSLTFQSQPEKKYLNSTTMQTSDLLLIMLIL